MKNKNAEQKSKFKKTLGVYLIFIFILCITCIIYALLIRSGKAQSSGKTFNIVTFILGIIDFLVLGLLTGIVAKKNGLVEGLIAALIIILLALIVNLFAHIPLDTRFFLKGLTYILASALGGVVGVNIAARKH